MTTELFSLAEIADQPATTLFIYLYDDGKGWGIGTPAEAIEAVEYCGADASTLRYRFARGQK